MSDFSSYCATFDGGDSLVASDQLAGGNTHLHAAMLRVLDVP